MVIGELVYAHFPGKMVIGELVYACFPGEMVMRELAHLLSCLVFCPSRSASLSQAVTFVTKTSYLHQFLADKKKPIVALTLSPYAMNIVPKS